MRHGPEELLGRRLLPANYFSINLADHRRPSTGARNSSTSPRPAPLGADTNPSETRAT